MSTLPFASRLDNVSTSAIREIFKLLGRPGIISFAGGFPDPALFDVEGIREATHMALSDATAGPVLQYGPTEGWPQLKEAIAVHMAGKGISVQPDGLITTTGSQQALDLIGKTMISPGDKVIVEGPTFLATIQCFKLYGADLVSAPIDADGVRVDELERLIIEHKPKLVYLIPSFGNPSGAMLTLERRKKILHLALQHQVLVVEDDPYGELYFDQPPPPSIMALANDLTEAKQWLAYCGSFSKVLSPGLRVGWMIAPAELLAKATVQRRPHQQPQPSHCRQLPGPDGRHAYAPDSPPGQNPCRSAQHLRPACKHHGSVPAKRAWRCTHLHRPPRRHVLLDPPHRPTHPRQPSGHQPRRHRIRQTRPRPRHSLCARRTVFCGQPRQRHAAAELCDFGFGED
jgi:Aminotransferase class I and II